MDNTSAASARWHAVPLAIVRAPLGGEAWRSLTHLVTGSVTGLFGGLVIFVLFVSALAGTSTVVVSIAAVVAVFPASAVLAKLQRSRHTAFLGLQWPANAPSPLTFAPRAVMAHLRAPKTWRQLSYHVIAAVYGPVAAVIAIAPWAVGAALIPAPLYWIGAGPGGPGHPLALSGVGAAMLLAAPWATRGLAAWDAAMAWRLLGSSRNEELALRVSDLEASRNSTVDAADAERRRIERDLHDGAQQRLTSLAMNLGIARAALTDTSEPGARAVEQAHEEAKLALGELRDLVRGLHPAVLEDRGLDAALSAVAARSPVPVRLRVDMAGRAPRELEAVAYFVVSEALTNAAAHASAQSATVDVALRDDRLRLRISDDGVGGADPGRGTGLRGLADRVRSVEGTFRLISPAGGPTTVEAELPCAS